MPTDVAKLGMSLDDIIASAKVSTKPKGGNKPKQNKPKGIVVAGPRKGLNKNKGANKGGRAPVQVVQQQTKQGGGNLRSAPPLGQRQQRAPVKLAVKPQIKKRASAPVTIVRAPPPRSGGGGYGGGGYGVSGA